MDERYSLYHGDCLDVLPTLPADSVDTVITDPPYHLLQASRNGSRRINLEPDSPYGRYVPSRGFMGKEWDGGDIAFRPATWAAVLRVAKPGALLLVFGGTRTWHRLAVAIEDAGWELRDTLMWLYGVGFPKSLDISKAIDKWQGAERPVVGYDASRARPNRVGKVMGDRPYDRSDNGATLTAAATPEAALWTGWGTALKPAWEPILVAMKPLDGTYAHNALTHGVAGYHIDGGRIEVGEDGGRWPANLILDEDAGAILDAQTGESVSGGGASRFFYTAKASKSERNAGVGGDNTHPTVKPLALMRYLCRLTATPTGGVVLDPFMGSASTGVAALQEGRGFVGIEREAEYLAIAEQRLAHAAHEAAAAALQLSLLEEERNV